ncbi:MAG: YicC family protein [Clostridia bacterium]|nr:YicC family protein [Clostridia bacterium]
MIKSMTAFGRHTEIVNNKNITVEIKSVNNRYFDCSVRISRNYSFLEEKIKPYLQNHGISRGKVDVSITIEQIGGGDVLISLNEEYAKAYFEALKQLKETLDLPGEITVATLQRDSNIFTLSKVEEDEEQDFADLCVVLNQAIEKFVLAREREGANIEADLRQKVEGIKERVAIVEAHSEEDITSYRSRLEEKLKAVLTDNKITLDENRILTECAIFADKVAVDEEIVRLRSHFKAFEDILTSNEPVGRKLDFLMQEMNRETNTIGSKCSNSSIAHVVVDIKCELEKIREQIQNIE